MAVTEKVAFCPAVMVCGAGCMVMAGATTAAVTVNVAAELMTLPPAPETTTRYCAPLSAGVVAAVVWLAAVAPATSANVAPAAALRCHW